MGILIGIIIIVGIVLVWFTIPYSPVKSCLFRNIMKLKVKNGDVYFSLYTSPFLKILAIVT